MWQHDVSYDWLVARCSALTATDIKDLLPVTATGRTRKITDDHRWKVLSRKVSWPSPSDVHSTGYAARGHVLEPYAVDAFNKASAAYNHGRYLSHWDDCVIKRDAHKFCLGFSPDALSCPQGKMETAVGLEDFTSLMDLSLIGEVKCYANERHLATAMAEPKDTEERWQIATAMAVCDEIERGVLILYNPRMLEGMDLYAKWWTRDELKDEISTIKAIEKQFIEFVETVPYGTRFLNDFLDGNGGWIKQGTRSIEDDIEEQETQIARLNP